MESNSRIWRLSGKPKAIEPDPERHRRGERGDEKARPGRGSTAPRLNARAFPLHQGRQAVAQARRRVLPLDVFAHHATQRHDRRVTGCEFGLARNPFLERERARRVELAVGQRVDEKRVLVVAHDLRPSVAISSARARARRDITVPMGAPVASAISR